jgi:hypothetical protein
VLSQALFWALILIFAVLTYLFTPADWIVLQSNLISANYSGYFLEVAESLSVARLFWVFADLLEGVYNDAIISFMRGALFNLWLSFELFWRVFIMLTVLYSLPHLWRKFWEWFSTCPSVRFYRWRYNPYTGKALGNPTRARECYTCGVKRLARKYGIKIEALAIASQVLLLVPKTVMNEQSCKYRILQKLREFSPDATELEITDTYLRCVSALAKESPGETKVIKAFSSSRARSWTERINTFLRPLASGPLPTK